jgi:hypothetical protein
MKSRVLSPLPLATATLVFVWGCGDASLPEPGPQPSSVSPSAGPAPAPSATPGDTASPAPAAQPLAIRGFTHGADSSVLPGVEVCLHDGVVSGSPTDPVMCTVSAGDGSFTVSGASANGAATLTFRKDGFAPTVRPIELQTADVTLPSSENVLLAEPLAMAGTAADPTRGQIAFAVATTDSGPAPQVTASLVAFLVAEGSYGVNTPPVYLDGAGAPAPGAAAGNSGDFVNVPPGVYMIQFHPTSGYCVPNARFDYAAGQDPNGDIGILVPVLQGFVTAPVGIWCTSDGP